MAAPSKALPTYIPSPREDVGIIFLDITNNLGSSRGPLYKVDDMEKTGAAKSDIATRTVQGSREMDNKGQSCRAQQAGPGVQTPTSGV